MMRCEEALRDYSALLDSELAPEAVAPVRVHLERCTACAEEARRFLLLHKLRGALHSGLFLDPGRAGQAETAWRRRLERRRRLRLWVPAAAAAALLVGVLLALREGTPPAGPPGTILVLPGGGMARMEEPGAAEPIEDAVRQTGGSVRYQPASDLRIDTAAGALIARAGSDVRVTVYADEDPRRGEVLRRHGLDPRRGPLALIQCLEGSVAGGVVAASGVERVLRPAEAGRRTVPEAARAPRSDAPQPAIVRKPPPPPPAPEPRSRTGARWIKGSVAGLSAVDRVEVGVYPLAPRVGEALRPLRREQRTRPDGTGAFEIEAPAEWPRRVAVYLVEQGLVTDVREHPAGGRMALRTRSGSRMRRLEGHVTARETFQPLRAAITVADAGARLALREPIDSGADGRFLAMLPAVPLRVEARAPGFGAELVEVPEGAPAPDLRLRLLPEGRIEGRILDGRGHPVQATMDLRKPTGARAAWDSHELPATDAQGRFRVAGVAEGEYQLVARPRERSRPPMVVPVHVARRRTTETLVRVEPAPVRYLAFDSGLSAEEGAWWEGRLELRDEREVVLADETLTGRDLQEPWQRALPAGRYRVRIEGIGTEPVDEALDFRAAVQARVMLRPR